jgi:hypothetical protein
MSKQVTQSRHNELVFGRPVVLHRYSTTTLNIPILVKLAADAHPTNGTDVLGKRDGWRAAQRGFYVWDLNLRAYQSTEGVTFYDFDAVYKEVYSINASVARAMAKTLTAIEKAVNESTYRDRDTRIILAVAKALGIEYAVCDGREPGEGTGLFSDSTWYEMPLSDFINDVQRRAGRKDAAQEVEAA